jgi:hypothetical protein
MKNCNLNKACVLPFSSFNSYPMGKARPCPMADVFKDIDLNKKTIDESFNSAEYKKLRVDMMSGEENEICRVCYNMEEWGSKSYRQMENEEYEKGYSIKIEDLVDKVKEDGEMTPNFIKLDMRPSNVCNFKCRTCSPEYSTRWVEEQKAWDILYGNKDIVKDYNVFHSSFGISKESIKNLKHIYIAGGETLYMEEMYIFLDEIENKSQININIHTNFSILKFKKYDVFKLLENFSSVTFFISIDGIGEVGEYVRTGFKWNLFCENLEKLIEIEKTNKNFHHFFHYTSSILNVFHFFTFYSEIIERKFINDDSQINYYPVRWPTYYNSINFNIKDKILDYYEKNLHVIKSDSLKTQIQNFINFISKANMDLDWDKEANESGVDKNATKLFKEFVTFGNQFNKTTIPNELSYLNEFL